MNWRITRLIVIGLCFFGFGTALFGQVQVDDPANGVYVSGEYEVVLSSASSHAVAKTRIYLDGREVFSGDGWVARVSVDFGEAIARHELFAVIDVAGSEPIRSEIVVTKELKVDYAETSRLVLLSAVVKTRSNKSITGLTRDQFRVYENGALLEIESFYQQELPLDLVLLLDTSSSLREEGIEELKHAATMFIKRLVATDRVALFEFKRMPHRLIDFTTDRKRLTHRVGMLEAIGETALFNALHQGLADLNGRSRGRKAVILFTDGRDSFYDDPRDKARMMRAAIRQAQNDEVTIFTLGLGKHIHKDALDRIARETGGRFYHADRNSRLSQMFTEILADLKNQYMLGVIPKAANPGFQRIEVKIKKRGAVVYARDGYTRE